MKNGKLSKTSSSDCHMFTILLSSENITVVWILMFLTIHFFSKCDAVDFMKQTSTSNCKRITNRLFFTVVFMLTSWLSPKSTASTEWLKINCKLARHRIICFEDVQSDSNQWAVIQKQIRANRLKSSLRHFNTNPASLRSIGGWRSHFRAYFDNILRLKWIFWKFSFSVVFP